MPDNRFTSEVELMLSVKKTPKIPPFLAIFFAILAVSTASPFIRFAQEEAPSIVIAAFRMTLASLLLLPFAAKNAYHEIQKIPLRQKTLLVVSGFFLALHFASWISSLQYTTVASSVMLVSTTPLWVALLSPIFLRERLAPAAWVGLFIAIAGGILVGAGGQCTLDHGKILCADLFNSVTRSGTFGNFLAILGAWGSAGYLLIGRRLRPSFSLSSYTFLVYGVAGAFLLLAVWMTGNRLTGYSFETYGWFLGMAVIPQLVGHSTLNWALKYLSASYVSISLLGEPIGTIILTYFLLREKPTLFELLGGVCILAGIYLATNLESRSRELKVAG